MGYRFERFRGLEAKWGAPVVRDVKAVRCRLFMGIVLDPRQDDLDERRTVRQVRDVGLQVGEGTIERDQHLR